VKYIKTLLAHSQLLLFLAVFWTFLIAFLCLDDSSDMPTIAINNVDKAVHFCFHFILTWLWFFYFVSKNGLKSNKKCSFIAFLIAFSFGVFIEWAQQTFTISRKADVFDVCANTAGALVAILVSNYILKKTESTKT
jgi:VanZ family protein